MYIVTAKEMYDWDRKSIEEAGMDGKLLMENAGRAVAGQVEKQVRSGQHMIVLIGAGNNGGDGFVIARTLLNKGYAVKAWQLVPDEKIRGDALAHKQLYLGAGYELNHFTGVNELFRELDQADVIIDAMLGIGVEGKLKSPFDQVVAYVNQTQAFKIAVDIPTGLPADEGVTDFDGLQADFTCIIAAPKMSLFLQHTAPYYGEWEVVEIGLPPLKLNKPSQSLWESHKAIASLPKRSPFSHKGTHGKGLLIGGSCLMPGSIALSARAALRSGAGLAAVATPGSAWPSVSSHIPEATAISAKEADGMLAERLDMDFSGYDGIALGMGMGRSEASGEIVRQVIEEADVPVLIDADGLYHLRAMLEVLKNRNQPAILTPHPGEMAGLLGITVPELLARPFEKSRRFACIHGVYLVLKGPATIITTPDGTQVVETSGNAGLAKGGSGDVLSGILLALIMQSESISEALCNGCFLHGKTAELLTAEEHSQSDLLATDLIEGLSQSFRTFVF
ncbi:bifunctional ADP-dependent NAD(P)H-hydrate dehydratase/NAD(P)H-hydrate epimerase [Thalassobacillus devorans]|uniref:bifunctional ADP-dependent NAD(P)H-hydrate dehydratase/NAD(P)H-hydrate epimerase n=1 Tax=Thalassobacillus devorans TaxID=279813 RepID=UPI00048B496E|nr:bifunctional ADP-dependent NAD(P)H-hydrate dehydratase/NAD(P)H-hydrate epimerase [Thalassobacillus devorans]